MKNFDLNACGVQEMNAAEVAEVNGGYWAIFGRNDFGGDPKTGWATCNLLGVPIGIYYTW